MIVGPLHRYHERAGARFLSWGGWRLPAAFTSAADEVRRVRATAGYTDFPFLNHIVVRGPDALATLQHAITRDLARCGPGQGLYTLMLNDDGSVVDDGLVLRLRDDLFVVSVPCRNPLLLPRSLEFLELKAPKEWLCLAPASRVCAHELGAFHVSVQGPRSRELLRPVVELTDLQMFGVREAWVRDIPVIVSRTGFSGELGFEFLVWPEHAPALWETIVELGASHDAGPYGMEATLLMGLEKGYVMGFDFFPGSTPLEVGLAWALDLDKPDFVGRSAVLRRQEDGVKVRLAGLQLPRDGAVPVPNDPVLVHGKQVGLITNAADSPQLGWILARAWLPSEIDVDAAVDVVTTGGLATARVCRGFRFYDPRGLRIRM
jgi:aminomethyltransferase